MLGEVGDVWARVIGLEETPLERCSLLTGLKINSQSSDYLELAAKELFYVYEIRLLV